ncbi:MAG: hypothetical protein LBM98_03595 [Oscillospiraceae bacterium]|jgi:hypothetical protein|nr:hypothetical protein [Oscillospiraceae bacterium]
MVETIERKATFTVSNSGIPTKEEMAALLAKLPHGNAADFLAECDDPEEDAYWESQYGRK